MIHPVIFITSIQLVTYNAQHHRLDPRFFQNDFLEIIVGYVSRVDWFVLSERERSISSWRGGRHALTFVCSSGVTEALVKRPEKPSVANQFVQSDLRPVLAFLGTGTFVSADCQLP